MTASAVVLTTLPLFHVTGMQSLAPYYDAHEAKEGARLVQEVAGWISRSPKPRKCIKRRRVAWPSSVLRRSTRSARSVDL